MKTVLLTTSDEDLKKAGEMLYRGALIAFPTETVFGLGANACDEKAIKKIFDAKGRPQDNPLIMHFDEVKNIEPYIKNVNDITRRLFQLFPSPLTVICDKTELVNNCVSGGLSTVAVRVPKNEIARKLIKYAGVPIAAPSANISTRPSCTTWQNVKKDFDGKIEAIICGEASQIGVESTVVDARFGETVKVLRLGGFGVEELIKKGFKIELSIKAEDIVHSPGTRYKHYAPSCEFVAARYDSDIPQRIIKYVKNTKENCVIFCHGKNAHMYESFNVVSLGALEEEIAHKLFASMRETEDKFDVIICESFENKGLYRAVNNRIFKAASKTI